MLNRWTYHPGITENESMLFYIAIGENKYCYQPLAVANIDELRYRFMAYSVVGPSFPTQFAIVEIYKPRSGESYVTRIIPINVDL